MNKKKEIKVKNTVLRNEVTHWVCQETGEMIETNEILKPISRQGFMITYLSTMLDMIEKLGNRKMLIIKYILENMDKSSNSMFCTVRELAEKTKTSTKTVNDTLKLLEDNGIIQRRVGGIMINPRLIHRGDEHKEKALLTRFYDFNENN